MTAVGFEPTPLRTGAWSQRLRPLGQTVMFAGQVAEQTCRLLGKFEQIDVEDFEASMVAKAPDSFLRSAQCGSACVYVCVRGSSPSKSVSKGQIAWGEGSQE